MDLFRFYIQQTYYDGTAYQKGTVVDSYESYGAACKNFSEILLPESKPIVTRDWPGEDGLEIYVPQWLPMKEFDADAEFIIVGKESLSDDAATEDALDRRRQFIKFLYGRNAGAVGGRLAIYDEHSGLGYKDVVVKKVQPDTSERQHGGNPAVYVFKVTFTVHDPVTEVAPVFKDGKIDGLTWA